MLTLGVFHSYFEAVPAFGYWATFLVVFTLRTVVGAIIASTE